MNIKNLGKELPYKWKVQSCSEKVCTCVAYIDARVVFDVLDESVGPENWQTDFRVIKDRMFAGIGIKVGEEWVWKWDCGTESDYEKEKGEVSDSIKRAGVQWKIGRFLYSLEIQQIWDTIKVGNKWYPAANGKRVWDVNKLISGKKPPKKNNGYEPDDKELELINNFKDEINDAPQAFDVTQTVGKIMKSKLHKSGKDNLVKFANDRVNALESAR
jgi:hypothetical protein